MTFASLKLSELILSALSDEGYEKATPIQLEAIPVILTGSDLLAAAQTGTGKTASFAVPILQRLIDKPRAKSNHIKVLVLAPTRELAAQIYDSFISYGKNLRIRTEVVFGGVKINPQMMKLRAGVEVLIATPGRLLDLASQNAIRFDEVDTLVLDEADRMLDMGFIVDIKKIIAKLPFKRQNLLFSATFSKEIKALANQLLKNPKEVSVTPPNTAAPLVKQIVHPVDKGRKAALLSHLIRHQSWFQALVFARTKHGANKLVKQLAVDGIEALAIHGNKSQSQRTKALTEFKQGKIQILVATDIAARGIDIEELPLVVNFDLPNVPEDYIHRIGRTGRAGSEGGALSLVSADEIKQLKDIERLIKKEIPRICIDDFEPTHDLPKVAPKSAQVPVRKVQHHGASASKFPRTRRGESKQHTSFSKQRDSRTERKSKRS